jgi:N-acetylglucosamine malate deacetylase 1
MDTIYENFVTMQLQALQQKLLPPQVTEKLPVISQGVPTALLFSPHPDDESIGGALPLRLMQESGYQIINVPMFYGSVVEQRARRQHELEAACSVLRFAIEAPTTGGFSGIKFSLRDSEQVIWKQMVALLAQQITQHQPAIIICPHAEDGHPSHVGAHFLVIDALATMPKTFECGIAFTEYWQPQREPNLLMEIDASIAGKMIAALSCHAGETSRNPFHLRLPAWLMDNVRRGAETVGARGSAAPDFDLGIILQIGRWKNGKFIPSMLKRNLSIGEKVAELFS